MLRRPAYGYRRQQHIEGGPFGRATYLCDRDGRARGHLVVGERTPGDETRSSRRGGLDAGVNPYSTLSNEQLGTLAGTFEDLDRDQRRWFLTEVRKRMSAKGEGPRIEVDQGDRFGRVVNQVGGADQKPRETRIPVRTSPPDEERADATKVYGTGVRPQAEETADVSTPTLRSEDSAKPSE